MKKTNVTSDKLYNIFQREKERVGDKYDLFYNEQNCSLQYKDEVGKLTVKLNTKEHSELMYYRPNDSESKGIGEFVMEMTNGGRRGYAEIAFDNIPKEFQELCKDYMLYFNRNKIGVELPKAKTKSNYERD